MEKQEKPKGEMKNLGTVQAEILELNMPLSDEFVKDPVGFTKKFLESHGQVVNKVILAPEFEKTAAMRRPISKWIHIKSGEYKSWWLQIFKERPS